MKKHARFLFLFDTMWTPKMLVGIYWLSLLTVIVATIIELASLNFVKAALSLTSGVIVTRVCFELLMLAFKNNEYLCALVEQKHQDEKRG